MPHSRTAKKNVRKNLKRRAQNRAVISDVRTQLKRVRQAVAEKDTANSAALLAAAQRKIDKAAKTHRMHRNKAARLKSRLAAAVHRMGAAPAPKA